MSCNSLDGELSRAQRCLENTWGVTACVSTTSPSANSGLSPSLCMPVCVSKTHLHISVRSAWRTVMVASHLDGKSGRVRRLPGKEFVSERVSFSTIVPSANFLAQHSTQVSSNRAHHAPHLGHCHTSGFKVATTAGSPPQVGSPSRTHTLPRGSDTYPSSRANRLS